MNNPELLAKTFFTNAAGTVCIVRVKNGIGETKSYISSVDGDNEENDVNFTIKWGAKFPDTDQFWNEV